MAIHLTVISPLLLLLIGGFARSAFAGPSSFTGTCGWTAPKVIADALKLKPNDVAGIAPPADSTPWVGSIQNENGHVCSVVFIQHVDARSVRDNKKKDKTNPKQAANVATRYALTAVTCVEATTLNSYQIVFGGRGEDAKTVGIENIAAVGELLVLKLNEEVSYDKAAQPVCLSDKPEQQVKFAHIVGWGKLTAGPSNPENTAEEAGEAHSLSLVTVSVDAGKKNCGKDVPFCTAGHHYSDVGSPLVIFKRQDLLNAGSAALLYGIVTTNTKDDGNVNYIRVDNAVKAIDGAIRSRLEKQKA